MSSNHHPRLRAQRRIEMKYATEYWEKRFEVYKNPQVPEKVKAAIKKVYNSYPKECLPQGLCDPMYIINTICLELGIGDGKGRFYL